MASATDIARRSGDGADEPTRLADASRRAPERQGIDRPGKRRSAKTRDRGRGKHRARRGPLSALTRRLLAINLVALLIVAGGILYLNLYEQGLVEERLDRLVTQGNIMASALGQLVVSPDPAMPQSMDPLLARLLLQRLVLRLETRARLFDRDGSLVVDSRRLAVGGAEVRLRILPPPEPASPLLVPFYRLYDRLDRLLSRTLPLYIETRVQKAQDYVETVRALRGEADTAVRRTIDGGTILTAAVPVQRFKQVVGALMLDTGTSDIDLRVRQARGAVIWLCAVAFGVTALLSVYLAGTIARPIRLLAVSAERVARGQGRHGEIPDLSKRGDEIGELSVALRQMTEVLRERIDAIEGFAADVAHEIKNPLSSLRSAIETIGRVNDPKVQTKLLAILHADVQRMDRLISDISAASRLDAELARTESEPVDLTALLGTLVDIHQSTAASAAPRLAFIADRERPVIVPGIERRMVQVFRNLIDNAVSFSPEDGLITIDMIRADDRVDVIIEDEGPGLPPGKTAAIFDRFYSQRPPGEKFGTHSGLGLSISKQIIEALGGDLVAENRHQPGGGDAVIGARFIVRIPV